MTVLIKIKTMTMMIMMMTLTMVMRKMILTTTSMTMKVLMTLILMTLLNICAVAVVGRLWRTTRDYGYYVVQTGRAETQTEGKVTWELSCSC